MLQIVCGFCINTRVCVLGNDERQWLLYREYRSKMALMWKILGMYECGHKHTHTHTQTLSVRKFVSVSVKTNQVAENA